MEAFNGPLQRAGTLRQSRAWYRHFFFQPMMMSSERIKSAHLRVQTTPAGLFLVHPPSPPPPYWPPEQSAAFLAKTNPTTPCRLNGKGFTLNLGSFRLFLGGVEKQKNLRSSVLIPENATPYDEWNANKQIISQINLWSFAVSPSFQTIALSVACRGCPEQSSLASLSGKKTG